MTFPFIIFALTLVIVVFVVFVVFVERRDYLEHKKIVSEFYENIGKRDEEKKKGISNKATKD